MTNEEKGNELTKQLKEYLEKHLEIKQKLEDRHIENLADLAEMTYIEEQIQKEIDNLSSEKEYPATQ